jgi:tRNA-guanine family transglycosylase
LLSAIHAKDLRPLDEECTCSTCKTHSRSYLHHLYRAREPVVDTLLSVHNLQYMNDLMGRIRTQIMQDEL